MAFPDKKKVPRARLAKYYSWQYARGAIVEGQNYEGRGFTSFQND